eukprot:4451391-Alexandrium_andersonii.AAC.1
MQHSRRQRPTAKPYAPQKWATNDDSREYGAASATLPTPVSGEQHARTDARASAGSRKTGVREQHTRSGARIPQRPRHAACKYPQVRADTH